MVSCVVLGEVFHLTPCASAAAARPPRQRRARVSWLPALSPGEELRRAGSSGAPPKTADVLDRARRGVLGGISLIDSSQHTLASNGPGRDRECARPNLNHADSLPAEGVVPAGRCELPGANEDPAAGHDDPDANEAVGRGSGPNA